MDQAGIAQLETQTLHQALIRTCLAQGRQAQARLAYESCRRLLRHGLGTDPTAETQALVAG